MKLPNQNDRGPSSTAHLQSATISLDRRTYEIQIKDFVVVLSICCHFDFVSGSRFLGFVASPMDAPFSTTQRSRPVDAVVKAAS
jgi:hypothetical protein